MVWNQSYIGLNMLPSDSFMSCLHCLLGYHIAVSRLCNWLSLRRLVPLINHLCIVYCSLFGNLLKHDGRICKLVIAENNNFARFLLFHIYLYASKYGNTLFPLTIFSCVKYRKPFNISRTLVSNKIVDNSDVVGASPVGAAPTTSSFST